MFTFRVQAPQQFLETPDQQKNAPNQPLTGQDVFSMTEADFLKLLNDSPSRFTKDTINALEQKAQNEKGYRTGDIAALRLASIRSAQAPAIAQTTQDASATPAAQMPEGINAQKKLNNAVDQVRKTTADTQAAVVPSGAPAVSVTGASKPQPLSNNPTINSLVDSYNEQYVTKLALAKAFSRAEKNYGGYDKVYERVTGEKPSADATADAVKFNTALNNNIQFMQQLGGGDAGLDAMLSGRTELFMQQVKTNINKNDGKLPKITAPSQALSPQMQTLAGAVATVVAGYATGGLLVVGHEAETVSADTFMKKYEADQKGGVLNTLGNGATWLKEAIMGRKLSITLGANKEEGNVDKYYQDIKDFTKKIMDTPDISASTDPQIKAMYDSIKGVATQMKIDPKGADMKKAMIQSFILNEGYTRQGVDYKANIGLLFIGGGRESIARVQGSTDKDSAYHDAEEQAMKRDLESSELQKQGLTIEKKDGKWVHTIPAEVQFNGEPKIKVTISGSQPQNGKYVIEKDKVQLLHFTDNGDDNGYVVSMEDSTKQPSGDAVSATPTADRKQSADEVTKLREGNEKKFPLDEAIYFAGHTKEFAPYLRAMAGQDKEGARKALEAMLKGLYRTRARVLLASLDTIDNTYTYGSNATRATEVIDDPSEIRKQKVINAENDLAQKHGITQHTPDEKFELKGSPTQASSSYPGQEMTMLTFATAKSSNGGERGVLHRIDTMDGSFAVAGKPIEVTDQSYRGQIIDATANLVKSPSHGIDQQVSKLNAWLATSGLDSKGAALHVDKKDYIQYLKSDNISDLNVPGLELQPGKGTKVFEARARIAGNVCLNRTHGIVYPLFELKGTTPEGTKLAVTQTYSTPVKLDQIVTQKSALGASPLGLIGRKKGGGDGETPTPNTQPKPSDVGTNTGSTNINGAGLNTANVANTASSGAAASTAEAVTVVNSGRGAAGVASTVANTATNTVNTASAVAPAATAAEVVQTVDAVAKVSNVGRTATVLTGAIAGTQGVKQ